MSIFYVQLYEKRKSFSSICSSKSTREVEFNIHSSAFFDKCQNKMKNAIKRDWNVLCDASYPYADPLSPGIRYAVNNAMREDAYKNINRYFNRVMVNQNRDAQKKFLQENDAFKIMESYTYNSDSMIHLNMWTDIEAFENAGNILNSANISFLQPERTVDELFEIQKNSDPEKNKQNIAKIRDNIIERVLGMADSKCIPYLDAVLAERAEEDFYPSIKNEPSFFKNCCAIMEGKESKMHKDPDRILNRLLRSMQKTSKNSKQIDNDLGI